MTAETLKRKMRAALRALEETRWNPSGDLATWKSSADGRNFSLVVLAMGRLRAPGKRRR